MRSSAPQLPFASTDASTSTPVYSSHWSNGMSSVASSGVLLSLYLLVLHWCSSMTSARARRVCSDPTPCPRPRRPCTGARSRRHRRWLYWCCSPRSGSRARCPARAAAGRRERVSDDIRRLLVRDARAAVPHRGVQVSALRLHEVVSAHLQVLEHVHAVAVGLGRCQEGTGSAPALLTPEAIALLAAWRFTTTPALDSSLVRPLRPLESFATRPRITP